MPKSNTYSVHYAWVVLAVTFLCLFVASALRSIPGIIMMSLEQEFDWHRETISGAISLNLVLFGLAGPFLGRLMDLYGAKRISVITLILSVAGAGGSVFMQESWQMYLFWGLLIGAGSGGTSMIMGSALINRWFHRNRGLALGILGAAFSSGQLVFTPVLMQINVHEGWRAATLFIAVALGLVALPLVLKFLRDDPESKGLLPYGANGVHETVIKPDRNPMRSAMSSPQFWLLALSFGICGLTTSGLFQTHLIPHGIEHGFTEMTMATSLGVMGAADVFGTILSGWLCDRYGKRWPLAFYYVVRGATLILLPSIDTTGQLMIFSIIYGMNWLSTIPATSALTADLFGKQNVGVVFGWICFAHQIGAAIAAYSAGYVHSLMGDYNLAFVASGLFAFVATGIVLFIKEPQTVRF
ncbi:MFS transporter [Methylomonas methanica]|uniref:MFS transporter n=2 Tax=Methylomonas TaxID=416 RepID=A0A126T105_9GAMM|nr:MULTISPECIES: MFS transporter [Methylomonas]AMK75757.1 MFS transporter [Methylomonas denitrificans]OAH98338.1 MFS transporter [Methylomonas methanica]